MEHLWIINKESSTTLFYRDYTEMKIDPDLISGLLSAFNNFSEVELNGVGIESINMGGLQWVYHNDTTREMLVIAADSKRLNPEVTRARLDVIHKMFVNQFGLKPGSLKGAMHVTQYQGFAGVLDTIRDQWAQADIVMGAAELFDLLGVFQQIFNLIYAIVQNNFDIEQRANIIEEFKDYSQKLSKILDIEANPEFGKIEFDAEHGWSVITLDPTRLNKHELKKALFLISSHLRIVMVRNLGFSKTLYLLSRELLPYIFSSWELLEILDVIKPLLTILLEKPTLPRRQLT
ncbi:MAG: hypothetical protein ACTSUE_18235 [Promethearchaeota archaeon]